MKFLKTLFESKVERALRERAERERAARAALDGIAKRVQELSAARKDPRVSESQWTNLYKD